MVDQTSSGTMSPTSARAELSTVTLVESDDNVSPSESLFETAHVGFSCARLLMLMAHLMPFRLVRTTLKVVEIPEVLVIDTGRQVSAYASDEPTTGREFHWTRF